MRVEEVRIPVRDGSHLAATLYLPDPSVGAAAVPDRGPALPQGRPHLVVRRELPHALRGARLRRVPDRRTRHRVLAGRPARRVPGGRAERPLRRDRLDRRPGVVRRPGRDVGHLLLRLQLPPDRLRAAAGAEGHLRDLRHRRPLDRRRPLARRRAAAGRPRRLLPLHDTDVRPPARAGGLGRRVVRRVAAAPGDLRAVGADLAAGEPSRPLLGPRIRAAGRHHPGLRADRVSGADRRRLGRRLPQQLLPHRRRARPARRTASPAGRPVGARRPVHRDARAPDRLRRRAGRRGSTTGCAVRAPTRTAATSSSVRRPGRRSTSTCTRAGGSPCRPCRR